MRLLIVEDENSLRESLVTQFAALMLKAQPTVKMDYILRPSFHLMLQSLI